MHGSLVWFKRDLRVHDHAPLAHAASAGPAVGLYIYEPAWFQSPEFDPAHLNFVNQCLAELRAALRSRGGELLLRTGDAEDVLDRLHHDLRFASIHSHQETGLAWSFDRDRAVKRWTRNRGIEWREHLQHGVFRALPSRDGWARRWSGLMDAPEAEPPERIVSPEPVRRGEVEPGDIRTPEDLHLPATRRTDVQPGGEPGALDLLDSFLNARGVNYRADMASPAPAWTGCSRLSPHLAWGSLSIRRVHHRTEARLAELEELRSRGAELDRRWIGSVVSFQKRLRWHCHFIQKLEDEPDIEHRNMNRAYDGMRTENVDAWTAEQRERFDAWREGRTGYPLVDAVMRCLDRTGWINFRMRSMAVSFASYHLWLHWKPTAEHLARVFLDFEPGIHYAQVQMQSGVTGINTVRIYSPIKQVLDNDPHGVFIRRWVPELEGVPDEFLAEPHRMPGMTQHMAGCAIGEDYPEPIVNHKRAYAEAKDRIFAVRRSADAKREARRVYRKHGSRKRGRGGATYRGMPEDRGGAVEREGR